LEQSGLVTLLALIVSDLTTISVSSFTSSCFIYFSYINRVWSIDQAFDDGGNNTPLGGQIARSCTQNGLMLNQTMNNFGLAIVGEWSIAMNDCGRFVTAVGDGTRYEGNLLV
jgi:hypothetical protein